jgi:hypothetical protein
VCACERVGCVCLRSSLFVCLFVYHLFEKLRQIQGIGQKYVGYNSHNDILIPN